MHEGKIEQLNSASMRARKNHTNEKPFSKTQDTFFPKAFNSSWNKVVCKS
jgi:hypothetical protein